MELLVIRHAKAEERDEARWPGDRARPLTPRGDQRFQRAASGLRRLAPHVDLLLASPYARAWRTAQILHDIAGWPEPEPCDALEPGNEPRDVLDAIEARIGAGRLALVGHEPTLSGLVGLLLAGEDADLGLELRTGGAVRLRVDGELEPAGAELVWWLTQGVLRRLASS